MGHTVRPAGFHDARTASRRQMGHPWAPFAACADSPLGGHEQSLQGSAAADTCPRCLLESDSQSDDAWQVYRLRAMLHAACLDRPDHHRQVQASKLPAATLRVAQLTPLPDLATGWHSRVARVAACFGLRKGVDPVGTFVAVCMGRSASVGSVS